MLKGNRNLRGHLDMLKYNDIATMLCFECNLANYENFWLNQNFTLKFSGTFALAVHLICLSLSNRLPAALAHL